MKATDFFAIVFTLLATTMSVAQQTDFAIVDPGLGRFDLGSSYLDVTETDDGHIVEYSLTEQIEDLSVEPTLRFLASWRRDTWTQLVIDVHDPVPPDAFGTRFDPYNDGEESINVGSTFMLQPNRFYGISTRQIDFCETCPANTLDFEYSLSGAVQPLTADFNFDNRVNWRDYLILSRNYNRDDKFWVHGDANLDGTVNFSDFILLILNFGNSRSSRAAVQVPEPSTVHAWLWGVLVIAGLRRRRVRTSFKTTLPA